MHLFDEVPIFLSGFAHEHLPLQTQFWRKNVCCATCTVVTEVVPSVMACWGVKESLYLSFTGR